MAIEAYIQIDQLMAHIAKKFPFPDTVWSSWIESAETVTKSEGFVNLSCKHHRITKHADVLWCSYALAQNIPLLGLLSYSLLGL